MARFSEISGDARCVATTGVGLKAVHYQDILETRPAVGWFEVHTESYMGDGGLPHHYLEAIAADYPLSLHGTGMSLGSSAPLDKDHLRAVRELVERYRPVLVSEHLSWSFADGVHLNDLMELPLTRETLDLVTDRVSEFQDVIGRKVLLENPSSYLAWASNEISEPDFLNELARRSGCGLLVDVNNIYVSSRNLDFRAEDYIDAIEPRYIGEIHLAGHRITSFEGRDVYIDNRGGPVCDAVWDLYRQVLAGCGATPSLIEWDANVPALSVLLDEALKVEAIMRQDASRASAA